MNSINTVQWIRWSSERAEEFRQQAAQAATQPKLTWRLTLPKRGNVSQPVVKGCPAKLKKQEL